MASKYCPVINIASQEFLEKLRRIEPGVWGWPCAVSLDDGTSHEICLAYENKHYSDKGSWLSPHRVTDIRECKSRMPLRFARAIRNAEESGTGYHIYVVELADGGSFVHIAGNLGIDLVNLPVGCTSQDIINVVPHAGRERSQTEGCRKNDNYPILEFAMPD
jgi:hypothetical protein